MHVTILVRRNVLAQLAAKEIAEQRVKNVGIALACQTSQKDVLANRGLQLLPRNAHAKRFVENLERKTGGHRRANQQLAHLHSLSAVDTIGKVIEYPGLRSGDYLVNLLPAKQGVGFQSLADYLQARHPPLGPPQQFVDRVCLSGRWSCAGSQERLKQLGHLTAIECKHVRIYLI